MAKKGFHLLLLMILLLLTACDKDFCIEGDDWGFPKTFVPAKPQTYSEYPNQVAIANDTGRVLVHPDNMLVIKVDKNDFWVPALDKVFQTEQSDSLQECHYDVHKPTQRYNYWPEVLQVRRDMSEVVGGCGTQGLKNTMNARIEVRNSTMALGYKESTVAIFCPNGADCEKTPHVAREYRPDNYADCKVPCKLTKGMGLYMGLSPQNGDENHIVVTKHLPDAKLAVNYPVNGFFTCAQIDCRVAANKSKAACAEIDCAKTPSHPNCQAACSIKSCRGVDCRKGANSALPECAGVNCDATPDHARCQAVQDCQGTALKHYMHYDGYVANDKISDLIPDAREGDRVFMKIIDRYYNDNVGGYHVTLKYGTQRGDTGLFESLANAVLEPLWAAADGLFVNLILSFYNEIAIGILTLYITIYGLLLAMGVIDDKIKDGFLRILKVSVIGFLMSDASLGQAADGIAFIYGVVLKGLAQSGYYIAGIIVSTTATGDPGASLHLFAAFDAIIERFFSSEVHAKVWSTLFSHSYGIVYIIALYVALYYLFMALLKAFMLSIVTMVSIMMLIIIFPFLLFMILFDKLKDIFDEWINHMIGYSLQLIVLFSAVTMFMLYIIDYMERTIGYTVCWKTFFSMFGGIWEWKFWMPELTGEMGTVVLPAYVQVATDPEQWAWRIHTFTGPEARYIHMPYLNPEVAKDRELIGEMLAGKNFLKLTDILLFLLGVFLMYFFLEFTQNIAESLKGGGGTKDISSIWKGGGMWKEIGEMAIGKKLSDKEKKKLAANASNPGSKFLYSTVGRDGGIMGGLSRGIFDLGKEGRATHTKFKEMSKAGKSAKDKKGGGMAARLKDISELGGEKEIKGVNLSSTDAGSKYLIKQDVGANLAKEQIGANLLGAKAKKEEAGQNLMIAKMQQRDAEGKARPMTRQDAAAADRAATAVQARQNELKSAEKNLKSAEKASSKAESKAAGVATANERRTVQRQALATVTEKQKEIKALGKEEEKLKAQKDAHVETTYGFHKPVYNKAERKALDEKRKAVKAQRKEAEKDIKRIEKQQKLVDKAQRKADKAADPDAYNKRKLTEQKAARLDRYQMEDAAKTKAEVKRLETRRRQRLETAEFHRVRGANYGEKVHDVLGRRNELSAEIDRIDIIKLKGGKLNAEQAEAMKAARKELKQLNSRLDDFGKETVAKAERRASKEYNEVLEGLMKEVNKVDEKLAKQEQCAAEGELKAMRAQRKKEDIKKHQNAVIESKKELAVVAQNYRKAEKDLKEAKEAGEAIYNDPDASNKQKEKAMERYHEKEGILAKQKGRFTKAQKKLGESENALEAAQKSARKAHHDAEEGVIKIEESKEALKKQLQLSKDKMAKITGNSDIKIAGLDLSNRKALNKSKRGLALRMKSEKEKMEAFMELLDQAKDDDKIDVIDIAARIIEGQDGINEFETSQAERDAMQYREVLEQQQKRIEQRREAQRREDAKKRDRAERRRQLAEEQQRRQQARDEEQGSVTVARGDIAEMPLDHERTQREAAERLRVDQEARRREERRRAEAQQGAVGTETQQREEEARRRADVTERPAETTPVELRPPAPSDDLPPSYEESERQAAAQRELERQMAQEEQALQQATTQQAAATQQVQEQQVEEDEMAEKERLLEEEERQLERELASLEPMLNADAKQTGKKLKETQNTLAEIEAQMQALSEGEQNGE